MATVKRFEDLEIWQRSRVLCGRIYKITLVGSFSRDFKLRDQINNSSGSMMDNIAEGFERGSRNEFIYFLGIAKGSSGEVKSQLYRALDRNHINQEIFNELYSEADNISKMIHGMITYLNKSEVKGIRYKVSEVPPDWIYQNENRTPNNEYHIMETKNRKLKTVNQKQQT